MNTRWLLLLAPVLLVACLKDDLDPAMLTSNPLDRDYDGAPLVVLVEESTVVMQVQGLPDTVYRQTVRVQADLLPPLTTWTWRVMDLETGEETDLDDGSDTLVMTKHHAEQGTSYCFRYTLMVQFVEAKPYTYCGVADL